MSRQDILDQVWISIDNAINTEMGGRIYDTIAPQDTTLPYCLFTVVGDTPVMLHDSNDLLDMDLQIDIYGNADAGTATIRVFNDTLYAALHTSSITVGAGDFDIVNTIAGIVQNDINPDVIRVRSEYNIK